MKSSRSSRRACAFTLVELLCVIAIIGILAAMILPALNQSEARAKRIGCVNHLHQMGIAFQIFTHDHGDKFPMEVPTVEGGSLEFVRSGYAAGGEFYFSYRQFQSLSNELSAPSVLVCPTDTRLRATDFGVLQNSNLSYFVGVKAVFSSPDSILAGDRNLTANSLTNPSILHIEADNPLRWRQELHQFKGNILFVGGQVEEWNNAALASGTGSQQAGADLFMPTVLADLNAFAPGSAGYQNYSGANPGVRTPSPTPAAPASPATRPANTSHGGQGRVGLQTPGQSGTQSLPDVAGKHPSGSLSTNTPGGGTVTPEDTDPVTLTFDQRVVKFLRKIIIGTYLLVLLILLLLLAFKLWQRAKRKKEQREDAH